MVPTLTAGLLGSALEGGPSGGGAASLSPPIPGGGSIFLPWVVSRTTVLPLLLFSPSFIICVTNSLHGTPSPAVGFCFLNQSSLIWEGEHRRPWNQGKSGGISVGKGAALGVRY